MGRYLAVRPRTVQWSARTTTVTVWDHEKPLYDTSAYDPEIQDLEIMAVWDAEEHIKDRLITDFGVEDPVWHVTGPIWRERRVREERARRSPDAPWAALPDDWEFTP